MTVAGLVSVVIPAFNAERTIARTLASAQAQTYEPVEILVIDDGSTDATAAIVAEAAACDRRIRLIRSANGGVARARNRGILRARGEFVAFLDADDLWHPEKTALQVAALRERGDPSWAAAYALYRKIDEADAVVGQGMSGVAEGFIAARHLATRFVGNGSSLLVRRDAALAVGGFDPSFADAGLGGNEDLDFELRLAARYRIAAVRKYLIGYRIAPGAMSSNRTRMARGGLATLERHIAALDLTPGARRLAVASAHHYALVRYLEAGLLREAAGALAVVLRHDPALALNGLRYAVRVARRLLRRAAAGQAPERHPFDAFAPDQSLKARNRSRAHWRRMRILAAEDGRLERRALAPAPAPIQPAAPAPAAAVVTEPHAA